MRIRPLILLGSVLFAAIVPAIYLYDSVSVNSGTCNESRTSLKADGTSPVSQDCGVRNTKSGIRPLQKRPTLEETTEIMTTTIIPLADLPQQSLKERVLDLNRMLKKEGIPPEKLKVILSPLLQPQAHEQVIFEEFRLRDVPFCFIIKSTLNSYALRTKIQEGTLEVTTSMDPELVEESKTKQGETKYPTDPFTD